MSTAVPQEIRQIIADVCAEYHQHASMPDKLVKYFENAIEESQGKGDLHRLIEAVRLEESQ